MTDRDRKRLTCFINYLNYNMEIVKIAMTFLRVDVLLNLLITIEYRPSINAFLHSSRS